MANYQGNPQGGVKLVGPEQQAAAGAFQQMMGSGGSGGGGGLGAGQFLMGNSVPPALPVANDPLMAALASSGGTDPMAALMGLLGGGGGAMDPMAALMAAGTDGGAAGGASVASDPQAQLEDAVVNALSNPEFARELVRSDRSILQKVVKLLSSGVRLGG